MLLGLLSRDPETGLTINYFLSDKILFIEIVWARSGLHHSWILH